MMRTVPLSQLPQGLTFPPELVPRIRFNSARRQLEFDGFMSKRDFDKLIVLHNDLEYQRALERLFQICVFEADVPPERGSARMLYVGVAAAVLLLCSCSLFLWLR